MKKQIHAENIYIKKQRDSNIELLRILMMIVIIAHHYIVNSGVLQTIVTPPACCLYSVFNTYFALIFGWGGKTAINVFLVITGYFMCRQELKWKKVINLALEIVLYRWLISSIFLLTGYEPFNLKNFVKTVLILPYNFGMGFSSSFLGMYILIPFINKLIQNVNKNEFEKLILILLVLFTGFSSFCFNVAFEYLGWYVTVYLVGSYIRLYEAQWMNNKKIAAVLCIGTLLLSWLSIAAIRFASVVLNRNLPFYYFVADSNKIFAIATALGLFLFFKNIKIGTSKIINTLAASTFGVLMIHASSDTMRKWLWQDVCGNVEAFGKSSFALHAVMCTIVIYIVCVAIDILRKFLFKKINRNFTSRYKK